MRFLVALFALLFVVPAGADLRPIPLRGTETNLQDPEDSCGHEEPQLASRGAAGFLAVWLDRGQVVARHIGADGFPEGSEIELSPASAGNGAASAPRLVRTSDGRFVAAWLYQTGDRREIQLRRLGEDGVPTGSIQVITGFTPNPLLGPPALAANAGGSYSIVWSEFDPNPSASARVVIRGRVFNASGSPVGGTRTAATIPASDLDYSRPPLLSAVMIGSDQVLVGWVRPRDFSVFQGVLGQAAAPRLLYAGAPNQHEQALSMVAVGGGVLASWRQVTEVTEAITVRRLSVNGEPFNGTDLVLPEVLGAPVLAADPDGSRAALQWVQPGQEFDTEASFALLLNTDGQLLEEGRAPFRIDLPTIDTFGPQSHLTANQLAFGPGGKLAAAWQVWREVPFTATICDRGVAVRTQTFEIDEDAIAPPPDPSAGPYLTAPGVPGFRYKVRISETIAGKSEAACLPQTGCISGALAGRTEVLLRVVGPRPNGRLWPTVVRFTPSQVEVWIEQISTGERLYYLLPALDPEGADLIGTVDRDGFPAL